MSIEEILREYDGELVYIEQNRDMPGLLAYATSHAEVEDLLSLTEGEGWKGLSFGTRRAFCEAVGIGESTLAGWIKERRLPALARAVVGLLHLYYANLSFAEAADEAAEEYSKRDEVVVHDGDSFMIVDMSQGLHQPGKIVARNIPDKETAFRLISHNELRYAVKLAFGELERAAESAGREIPEGLSEYLGGLIERHHTGTCAPTALQSEDELGGGEK